MAEQTETLLKILNANSGGKQRASEKTLPFSRKRTAQAHNYRFRTNSVQIENAINTAGQVVRAQLPSYRECVGEIYLKVDLKAATAGNYKPFVGAQLIKNLKLRHSDVSYELGDPKEIWAFLLSHMRNKQDKEVRKSLFGNSAAAAGAQQLVIPLLQPWSCFFDESMYGPSPARKGQRGTLFPSWRLKENCVFEIQFASLAEIGDSGIQGGEIQNVSLCWEELVGSSDFLDKVKAAQPKSVVCPDFTSMPISISGETVTDITAVMSRAPVQGLFFYLQQAANTDDPFNCEEDLTLKEVEGDGRVLISNRDQNTAEQSFRDMLRGRPNNRPSPNCPQISFAENSGFDLSHATQQISNTSLNSVTCRVNTTNACAGKILAVHQRLFTAENGTIRNQNIY